MMATPSDLDDFAVGFAFTEGIVERLGDIRGVEVESSAEGWRVNIALSADKLRAHLARARALVGRTGCGLCGVEDLSQLPKVARRVAAGPPIAPAAIGAALPRRWTSGSRSIAGRARFTPPPGAPATARSSRCAKTSDATMRSTRRSARFCKRAHRANDGFFVITSRCSFEMVAKAAAFGADTLVSVSAPTSMAIERAQSCGLALIAVAREDQALSFVGETTKSTGEIAA